MAKQSRGFLQYISGAVILIAAVATALFIGMTKDSTARSATTLCPVAGAGAGLIILVDSSGPMSEVQARAARNAIAERISQVPIDTLVSVRAASVAREQDTQLIRCRPRRGEEVDTLTANPTHAQRAYDENFLAPIEAKLDGAFADAVALSDKSDILLGAQVLGVGSARDTGSEILITLSEAITFDVGSDQLKETTRAALQQVAQGLASRPELELRVTGHTDSTGTREENLLLSQRRAEAVAAVFEEAGVRGDRLRTIGLGPDAPVADNGSAPSRAANRRVEILVVSQRPVVESLQAMMADARPHLAPSARLEVVLVTDLLQNSDSYSVYNGGSWSEFQKTPAYQRLGDGLKDADVIVLRIGRDDPAISDYAEVLDFWRNYILRQGGRIVSDLTIGDI